MSQELLEDLLCKIKEEFVKTLVIEVSSDEDKQIMNIFFDNNVIDKIRAAVETARHKE